MSEDITPKPVTLDPERCHQIYLAVDKLTALRYVVAETDSPNNDTWSYLLDRLIEHIDELGEATGGELHMQGLYAHWAHRKDEAEGEEEVTSPAGDDSNDFTWEDSAKVTQRRLAAIGPARAVYEFAEKLNEDRDRIRRANAFVATLVNGGDQSDWSAVAKALEMVEEALTQADMHIGWLQDVASKECREAEHGGADHA